MFQKMLQGGGSGIFSNYAQVTLTYNGNLNNYLSRSYTTNPDVFLLNRARGVGDGVGWEYITIKKKGKYTFIINSSGRGTVADYTITIGTEKYSKNVGADFIEIVSLDLDVDDRCYLELSASSDGANNITVTILEA